MNDLRCRTTHPAGSGHTVILHPAGIWTWALCREVSNTTIPWQFHHHVGLPSLACVTSLPVAAMAPSWFRFKASARRIEERLTIAPPGQVVATRARTHRHGSVALAIPSHFRHCPCSLGLGSWWGAPTGAWGSLGKIVLPDYNEQIIVVAASIE